jgi:hypothetical protein
VRRGTRLACSQGPPAGCGIVTTGACTVRLPTCFGEVGVSRIFLSHSSENNAEAVALRDWLADNGWKDEIFLDLDQQRARSLVEAQDEQLHHSASRDQARTSKPNDAYSKCARSSASRRENLTDRFSSAYR